MIFEPQQSTGAIAAPNPSLSSQPTTFVGRTEELTELQNRLADPACRLLTLVGVGGIGKTCLALQVAAESRARFADGVYFVQLQPVQSIAALLFAIADALHIALSGQQPPFAQLCEYLHTKSLLLVLDNFEHLLDDHDLALVGELLAAAPRLKILVTSREVLQLREEWLFAVGGLPFPPPGELDAALDFAAVALFVNRARQVRADFAADDDPAALAHICQLVEGMPLALELAAAWVKNLTCAAIAAEIQQNLNFLNSTLRNLPERHRSIHAIFDHTWQQLSTKEQEVFARLSIFRGGFDRAAATIAGASLPLLSTLVDKALLRWESAAAAPLTDGRYYIHELLRQYGAAQLARNPTAEAATNDAHCTYFCDFLYQRQGDVRGGRQRAAFLEIRAELANIRLAWQWAIGQMRIADIHRAEYAIAQFCSSQGRYVEGLDFLEKAIAAVESAPPDQQQAATLAALLNQFGWLSIRLGRLAAAQSALERSRDLFDQWQSAPIPGLGTDPLATLATLANVRGDYAQARQLGEAARQRNERRSDPFNATLALYALTNAAYGQGDYQHAHAYAQQAYKLTQETDNRWFMAYVLNDLGAIARTLGDYAQAQHHFQAGYDIRAAFEDPEGMALALGQLGKLAIVQRQFAAAEESLQQSLALYQKVNDQGGQALALAGLGQIALATADHPAAQERLREALQIAATIRYMPLVLALFTDIGRLLVQRGQTMQGMELLVLAGQHPASDGETATRARQLLAEYAPQLTPEVVNTAKADAHAPDLADLISRSLLLLSFPMASTMAPPRVPDTPPATPVAAPPRAPVAPQPAMAPLVEPLSEREIEVLHLIAAGLQNREIAEKMTVTVSTVKTHINNIYRKLDVTNRVQALAKARTLHLL